MLPSLGLCCSSFWELRPDDPRDRIISIPKSPTLTCLRIWLYSVVAADHEGAAILPHWIRHYVGLGIPADKIFLLVHHNPMKWVLALSGLWRCWQDSVHLCLDKARRRPGPAAMAAGSLTLTASSLRTPFQAWPARTE